MKIIIDHEKYGQRATFETIDEAETVIRACGPDFAGTKFSVNPLNDKILNEDGDVVGEVLDP